MSGHSDATSRPTLAVVGGGPAGLAAASLAAEHGLRVEVFEARRQLGGRAGSFVDPRTGRAVDYCQHVSMGCCTALADFCRRTGTTDCFRPYRRLHFFSPEGVRYDFAPSRWLPAPLHLLPALMRLGYLTLGERLAIVRGLGQLVRTPLGRDPGRQADEPAGPWLRRHGQSPRVIERFWSVVLLSALSETVDNASLAAARKVFADGFLASQHAYELLVPEVPLGELFDRRVGAWLAEHGVVVHRHTRIRRIEGDARRATGLVLADGTRRRFDSVVVAVPWQRVRSILCEALLAALPELEGVDHLRPAAITAVHLWFDRPIMPWPHAALVGRRSQWVFRGHQSADAAETSPEHYYQVVISASHAAPPLPRSELVAEVCRELAATFPEAAQATMLHARVVTHPAAVFSVRPGVDRFRPPQQTAVENLALAGDWTSTGWPATMEGAVRSGYLAAESILRSRGLSLDAG